MRGAPILLFFFTLLFATPAHADKRHKKSQEIKPGHASEQVLVEAILHCLRIKSSTCYEQLFPQMELLSRLILANAPMDSRAFQVVLKGQNQPVEHNFFDSLVSAALRDDFDTIIQKGILYNLHWESIILQRYELHKMRKTRDTILEKVMPERFFGDVFFADALTGISYAIRVNDLNKIDGRWYGGQLIILAPVDNGEDLMEALLQDDFKRRKLAEGDSSYYHQEMDWRRQQIKTLALDENTQAMDMRTVAERNFYKGTFDKEIGVSLYLRHLKGDCGEPVCGYDALLKFHDQEEYILLHVSLNEDGDFEMTEDGETGMLFLKITKEGLEGTWTSASDKTVYDLVLIKEAGSVKRFSYFDRTMLRLSE